MSQQMIDINILIKALDHIRQRDDDWAARTAWGILGAAHHRLYDSVWAVISLEDFCDATLMDEDLILDAIKEVARDDD